jgi:exonuclease III
MHHYKIMSWNVHGLNNLACQEEVSQVVSTFRPDLVYLQETKLSDINSSIVRNTLGSEFDSNFVFLPASDTRGVFSW